MKKKIRVHELDTFRGIAAIMVVLFHFSMNRFLPYFSNFLRLGNTGVELFFMISGFVIFMTLQYVKSGREFIINRLSRLYPTYWLVVTLTFCLIILNCYLSFHDLHLVNINQYLINMTMFQHYFHVPDLDDPYWTMIVEMNFYIIMFCLYKANFLNKIKTIGLIVSVLIVLFVKLATGSLLACVLYYMPILPYWPLFILGILFYKIYINEIYLKKNLFFIAVLLGCQIILHDFIRNKGYTSRFEYTAMLVIYTTLFTLFVLNKLKFIVTRISGFFGKISYPLYLIHQYLSLYVIIPLLMFKLHLRFLLSAFITLALIIILATLISTYIEVPVRNRIKKIFF